MANGNKPAKTIRIGYVKATIWKNEDFFNVTLTRSYKDDEGNWKDGDSLGHADLLNAAKALTRAEQFIAEQS